MTSTSEKLCAAASEHGWQTSRLRANEGKVAVDYFARGRSLLKVVYDTRGRVIEALYYHAKTPRLGRTEHVGHGDTDKFKTVLCWIEAESK